MLYSRAVRAFLIGLVLATACGNAEVEQLEKVKGEVCSCKDSKCAEAAMTALPKDQIKAGHQAQLIARQMLDCLSRLYEAERPAPADADGDSDGGSGP